jgi:hypothetical protein
MTQFKSKRTHFKGEVALLTDSSIDEIRGFAWGAAGEEEASWRELFEGWGMYDTEVDAQAYVEEANRYARSVGAGIRFVECYQGTDEYVWLVLFLEETLVEDVFFFEDGLLAEIVAKG